MGYRIIYDPEQSNKYPKKKIKKLHTEIMATILVVGFLIMLASNPAIRGTVRKILIPGDPVRTEQAATDLVNSLKQGMDLNEAVTAFCLEILDGSKE